LPKTPDVITAVFSSDIGVDNDALSLPGNGYLWYDVTGITPSRERPLDEVKDEVATRWRDDEIAKRLQAKVDEMVGKLKAGTTLAQLATETGLTVATANDLQRRKAAGFIPVKAVDAVFKTPKGATGSVEGESATQRFVYRVTDVVDPKLDASSPDAKQLSTTLQNSYADDIIGEYIGQIENDLGININQSALNQVIGGSGSDQ
jgi:peptidyl-prolyl cis-trans isomerase D